MTTRRRLLAMAGAGGVAMVAGCTARKPAAAVPPVAVPDGLLVDTTRGLALVEGTRRQVVGTAVATGDGRTIYAAAPKPGGGTQLSTIRTSTGTVSASVALDGTWVPRVASVDGGLVALMPPAKGGTAGRTRTRILVADQAGPRYRLDLAGNVEPDAFGRSVSSLFILDWLPPATPDRYRVRAVDLMSGSPGPLLTRNKTPVPLGAEEEMRGTARQAVLDPNMSTLFTLYTNQPDHQHTRNLLTGKRREDVPAFVHTLNLDVGWAYCIDLPNPFGHGAPASHTIASVAGSTPALAVADFSSGTLALVDSELLTVQRVVALPKAAGTAASVAAPDGRRLYLGIGTRVYPVDLAGLTVGTPWQVGGAVRGLAVSRDGSRLLVGYPGAVDWLDAATGRPLGRAPVAGLTHVLRAT